MLSLANEMQEGQGVDPHTWHAATVVMNNDPNKWGRIQARVDEIFDGIPDNDLPWAIPAGWDHTDGGHADSGVVVIPKVGSKVQVRFQRGDVHYPEYKGYHVDETTKLQESIMNYPDRAVMRFQNKTLAVVDTKDNIIYMRSPGDVRICIVGNLQIELLGNLTELIHGNVHREIRGNVDETILGNVTRKVVGNLDERFDSNVTRRVDGNVDEQVGGNFKESITGNHHVDVSGSSMESVAGNINQCSSGQSTYRAGATLALEGNPIHENSGVGEGDPGASGAQDAQEADPPVLEDWPGIRGGAHGTY